MILTHTSSLSLSLYLAPPLSLSPSIYLSLSISSLSLSPSVPPLSLSFPLPPLSLSFPLSLSSPPLSLSLYLSIYLCPSSLPSSFRFRRVILTVKPSCYLFQILLFSVPDFIGFACREVGM